MAITPFQLPTAVISNGSGVNGWLDPTNILLVDDQFAVASGITNVLTVGIFNLSIPQDSTITNFTMKVRGYRGSFNTTLQIYAVDNSTGVDISYPLAPFQGFSGTNTTYTLASSLFGTTWTPDQANNIQIKLIADGELHLDDVQISADYVPNVVPVPVPTSTGQVVVDEFVEAIRFNLAQSMTDTDLFCFLQSFNLPDGTPIQYADFHNNPTTDEACLVIDQGIPGLEEQVVITAVDQDYQGTGLCRLSFGSLANRGLKFIYPYDSDPALIRNHSGTAEVVISNSARFYSRFLKKNQIDALVSAPIIVEDESVALADPAHTLDFQGAGVVVVNDGTDPFKKIITIPGNGVNPPNVVSTSSSTSGASQVPSLTWSHTSSGINRLLVVQVEAEAASTITGITYNGVALTQEVSITNGTLRNEQWSLVAPPVGTYNIIVSCTPDSYLTCGAESYVSTDQTGPIGVTQTAVGSSLTPSLVLVTGTDNSLIVDSVATGTLPIVYTVGAGQTENWKITANPNVRQGASSVEPAGSQPDNVTMSWAITQSIPWAMTALEIKGVPSPSGFSLEVQDEGITVEANTTLINFIGAGVTAAPGAPGEVDVTIPGGGGQAGIQFQDEGVNLGTSGTVDTVDFVGAGVTATRVGNVVTATIPGGGGTDELVAVSAADTTPGFLQPKLNVHSTDGSVTVNTTITNPAGNEVLDIDLTGAGGSGGGGSTTENVIAFDDFINLVYTGQNGTNDIGVSGNFIFADQSGGGYNFAYDPAQSFSEIDHPGIIRIEEGSSYELIGFNQIASTTANANGLISTTNDFDITMLCRSIRAGANFDGIIGLSSLANFSVYVRFNSATDPNFLQFFDGAVQTITAVPIPATNTWFPVNFVWDAGTSTLNVTVNGSSVFSGTPAFGTPEIGVRIGNVTGDAGTFLDIDYVVTKYQVTRNNVPLGGGGGSSEKKVGVGDVSDINWFNIQYPLMTPNGSPGATSSMWDQNAVGTTNHSPSYVALAANDFVLCNSADYDSMLPDMDAIGGAGGIRFDTTKMVIVQQAAFTRADVVNGNEGGLGLSGFTDPTWVRSKGFAAINGVGFVRQGSDGVWYTKAANGVTTTENAVVISANAKHIFRIEYDPGNVTPQARFYVDGTLIDTITTDLPTASTDEIGYCFGNGDDAGAIAIEFATAPSFSVEI